MNAPLLPQLWIRTTASVVMHHYDDVIMSTIASQITSFTIVYSTIYSGVDQSKHQSSASLAFVWGIHRGPVNSPHKWPVTRKMFPFDDVIMCTHQWIVSSSVKTMAWCLHGTNMKKNSMEKLKEIIAKLRHFQAYNSGNARIFALLFHIYFLWKYPYQVKPVAGGFPSQSSSNAESVSMSWLPRDSRVSPCTLS